MKKRQADDEASIRELLDYLNVCHDGSMRRISFLKDRKWADDGGLAYPEVDPKDYREDLYFITCDVEIELLLDSYEDALPQQVIVLLFKEVRSFQFFQEKTFDYSDIYEVIFNKSGEREFEFIFRARGDAERIEMLRIVCPKIICTELGK
jgi:hypothetical protein